MILVSSRILYCARYILSLLEKRKILSSVVPIVAILKGRISTYLRKKEKTGCILMGLDSFPLSFFIHILIHTLPLDSCTFWGSSFRSHLCSTSQPLTTHAENLKEHSQFVSAGFIHSLADSYLPSRSQSALDPGSSSLFMSQLSSLILSLHSSLAGPIYYIHLFSQIHLSHVCTPALCLPPFSANMTTLPRN